MKYRQWKKNYKKLHGVNPPLELDKRRQRRLAKKEIKTISHINYAAVAKVATRAVKAIKNTLAVFMLGMGGAFDMAGTACRNIADNIQSIEIKERIIRWQVIEYDSSHYAVCETNTLNGTDKLKILTYSKKAAEKIAEILDNDYLEHIRQIDTAQIIIE